MKAFNLDSYGVIELNQEEQNIINGGGFWIWAWAILTAYVTLEDAANGLVDGVIEGYKEANNKHVDAISGAA